MRVLGIISEYNPFHNGHLYHLQQSIQKTGADRVICIMNGNFVQRGQPAILDKWSRAEVALKNGADLILELPLFYGIRSAEFFAQGAINLLKETKIVDYLVFGSEIGELKPLAQIADLLLQEPDYYQQSLRKYLQTGYPFPKAREKAILDFIKGPLNTNSLDEKLLAQIISQPNNILGIEYLKALKKTKANIVPLTIPRKKSSYHSLVLEGTMASATAIRQHIYENKVSSIREQLPANSWEKIKEAIKEGKTPPNLDLLGKMIIAKLRKMNPSDLLEFTEIDNGLENRIIQSAHTAATYQELLEQIKTRAYTLTRVQRNLLHIFFDLNRKALTLLDQTGPSYLRVLGFNQKGEELLSKIVQKSSLPVITQPAKYLKAIDLKSDEPLIKSLSYDLLATDIYTLLYPNSSSGKGHLDYTTPLIVV